MYVLFSPRNEKMISLRAYTVVQDNFVQSGVASVVSGVSNSSVGVALTANYVACEISD